MLFTAFEGKGKTVDPTMITWEYHASMCELLAFSLRYPTQELAQAVCSGEWQAAATEIANALGMMPSSVYGSFEQNPPERNLSEASCLHALRTEATRLFISTPTMAVSPYESTYRAHDDGVTPLLFVNPHAIEVETFMARCGVTRSAQSANLPVDSAATEFEFLQFLATVAQQNGGIPDQAVQPESFPGGSAAEAFRMFAETHACIWMPRFAENLALKTTSAFYRATAQLMAAYLPMMPRP